VLGTGTERPSLRLLAGVDAQAARGLRRVAAWRDRATFEYAFGGQHWTARSVCGTRDVPLCPGGARRELTWANRLAYVAAAVRHRWREVDAQCAAIRAGVVAVVPAVALRLFPRRRLALLACGEPDVDVNRLRATCAYNNGASAGDRHVLWLWAVLAEDLLPAERVAFLRFVSGRSRLPPSDAEIRLKNNHLRIEPLHPSGAVDDYLPVSHTCFFQLDLPAYSSRGILRDKLRYAFTHGLAIDTDRRADRGAWMEE
jgi:hypothetical protein